MAKILIVDRFPVGRRARSTPRKLRAILRNLNLHVRTTPGESPFVLTRLYHERPGLQLNGRAFRFTGDTGRKYRWRTRQRQIAENPWCRYCGLDAGKTIDHATPLSRGGDDAPDNLILCCDQCNSLKADATLAEWRDRLRQTLSNVEALLRAQASRRH